jgi:glycosyltransferase involved in cell wall biosynthesis
LHTQLHIANVLVSISESYGGPPKAAMGLGNEVQRLGNKVSYWTTIPEEDRPNLPAHDPTLNLFGRSWPLSWYRSPDLIKAIEREIQNIDILHLQEVWSHPQLLTSRIARRSGTPYVITPHGEYEPWRVRNTFVKHLKKKAYLSLVGRSMLRDAACVHAIAQNEVRGIRQIGYRGAITLIPNGIDLERYVDLPVPDLADRLWPQLAGKRVVLFLSRLSREKGLDQLVPAWAHLTAQDKNDDAILVIAGPDDRGYRAEVERLVEKYDASSNILLTGMVRGTEKMALVSRADIYTLPSYSEGFSMSILEALAASKPVLITPGCNFPEVADCGAGLSIEPDPGLLMEGFQRLLDMTEQERAAMGARGRALVAKEYAWEVQARKMLTVYKSILEGKDVPMHPEPIQDADLA